MKKYIHLYALLVPALLLIAWKGVHDIIAQLGIEEKNARTHILQNFIGDFAVTGEIEEDHGGNTENNIDAQLSSFKIPYTRLLPTIIKGDKVASAKALCNYVKDYVNSEEFQEDYATRKEKAKPTSEPWRPDAATIQSQEQSIKSAEKDIAKAKASKQVPESTLAMTEAAIQQQKKQVEAWKDPTPNKTKWEKLYPTDPAIAIKARLQEYLQLVATVDFNATLTSGGTKRKFVNPEYEKKSLKWKAIYRAGKEVNEAVTAFVKDWLKGDIISKEKIKMPLATAQEKNGSNTLNKVKKDDAEKQTDSPVEDDIKKEKKSLLKKLKEKVVN